MENLININERLKEPRYRLDREISLKHAVQHDAAVILKRLRNAVTEPLTLGDIGAFQNLLSHMLEVAENEE